MTGLRLLRIGDVCARTTLSRATVYREEAAGRFPGRVRLTECAVAWREADVNAWIETRQAIGQAA